MLRQGSRTVRIQCEIVTSEGKLCPLGLCSSGIACRPGLVWSCVKSVSDSTTMQASARCLPDNQRSLGHDDPDVEVALIRFRSSQRLSPMAIQTGLNPFGA